MADLNENVTLGDNSVHTVLLTDVLEQISRPAILMQEISRILRKVGKLILGVPFLYWLHEEPFDFHRFTKYQLKEFYKNNDLEILTIEESGAPLTVIRDIIAKNLPLHLYARLFQRIVPWLLSTKLGKRVNNRNKARFPRSYCLVAQKHS